MEKNSSANILDSAVSHLGVILRYVAPGVVGLIVLNIVYRRPACDTNAVMLYPDAWVETYSIWGVLGLALVFGMLVYSLHACVTARAFGWLCVLIHMKWGVNRKWVGSHAGPVEWLSEDLPPQGNKKNGVAFKKTARFQTVLLDLERWRRRHSESAEERGIQTEMEKWVAMLHFMYCTSLVLIVIPVLCRCFGDAKPCWLVLCLGGVGLGCVAVYTNFKTCARELWITNIYAKRRSTTSRYYV